MQSETTLLGFLRPLVLLLRKSSVKISTGQCWKDADGNAEVPREKLFRRHIVHCPDLPVIEPPTVRDKARLVSVTLDTSV